MRMSPDFSSFLIHSLTSTTSPGRSFRVLSTICLLNSFASSESISKVLVRLVSFRTFHSAPPSARCTVPWLPFRVTQPLLPSFMDRHWARIMSPSSLGELSSSTTSPASSFVTAEASPSSARFGPWVMVVSFTTFLRLRMSISICSLVREPAFSASSASKKRPTSSSVSASAPSSASQEVRNATKDSLVAFSSSFFDTLRNSSSGAKLFAIWCCLSVASTRFSLWSSSAASLFFASCSKCFCLRVAVAMRVLKPCNLPSSGLHVWLSQIFRSGSAPSLMPATSVRTPATCSSALLVRAATSSLLLRNSEDFRVSTLPTPSRAASTFFTASSTASTLPSASAIFSLSSSFMPSSSTSRASRTFLLSSSFTFSRKMPMRTLSLWKSLSGTPLAPTCRAFKTFVATSSFMVNLNSFFA
mmetsp:Transcript_80530/g.193157  ORF Transcript_80530/g.193157 Transcript_80530/m.193157 type:complete len:415 (+) Transcript_80530:195-1439(+)